MISHGTTRAPFSHGWHECNQAIHNTAESDFDEAPDTIDVTGTDLFRQLSWLFDLHEAWLTSSSRIYAATGQSLNRSVWLAARRAFSWEVPVTYHALGESRLPLLQSPRHGPQSLLIFVTVWWTATNSSSQLPFPAGVFQDPLHLSSSHYIFLSYSLYRNCETKQTYHAAGILFPSHAPSLLFLLHRNSRSQFSVAVLDIALGTSQFRMPPWAASTFIVASCF